MSIALGIAMKTSEAGLEFLKTWEGCELQIYPDQAGYATIGIGHLIRDGENFSGGLTEHEALELLARDVRVREDAVNRYVDVPLSQRQFDVLVEFTFNIGVGAFEASSLVRMLNDGDYDCVPGQLLRWKYTGGRVSQGLINRRKAGGKVWRAASQSKPRKKTTSKTA